MARLNEEAAFALYQVRRSLKTVIIRDCENNGALATIHSSGEVRNCLFTGNARGIFFDVNDQSTATKVINCTAMAYNTEYGIVSSATNGIPEVINSVLFTDQGDDISGALSVTYSLVGGGVDGTENIKADPLFVDAENGDFRLSEYSPAIGAGTDAGVPITDINGVERPTPANTAPDMGAYENALGEPLQQTMYYVSTSGSSSGTGRSDSHMSSIQDAINASSNGDTVLVSAGTYTENINFNGKNIVVGSLYITTADTSHISGTVIDGDMSGPVATFENGETNDAQLVGLTLETVGVVF